MNRYYTDKVVAINLDGIRCVTRIDGYSRGFCIQVTYKGNNFNLTYPTEGEREFAFGEILKALGERKTR